MTTDGRQMLAFFVRLDGGSRFGQTLFHVLSRPLSSDDGHDGVISNTRQQVLPLLYELNVFSTLFHPLWLGARVVDATEGSRSFSFLSFFFKKSGLHHSKQIGFLSFLLCHSARALPVRLSPSAWILSDQADDSIDKLDANVRHLITVFIGQLLQ